MSEKLEIIIHAKDQFSRVMKSLRGMLPSVKTLAIGAGAAVAGLGTGLFAIANSTAKAGDEFQKMSLRLGLSTELLSGMKHAIELSGSSIESLEKGVRTLAKRMSDADDGLAEAKRSFDDLGITVKNADGSLKDLDIMVMEASEGLANMEDNTKRVALAQDLFGRAGTQLLPLMKQGADGLRKMTDEAKALGITFDKTGADQAAAFKDNMLRVHRVLTGVKTQIGQALIPIFNEYAGALQEVGKELVSTIRKNKDDIKDFAESFLNIMVSLAQGTATGIALMIDAYNELPATWERLKKGFAELGIDILSPFKSIKEGASDLQKTSSSINLFFDRLKGGFFEFTKDIKERFSSTKKTVDDTFKDTPENMGPALDAFEKLKIQSEENLKNLEKHPSALKAVTDAFAYFRGLIEKIKAEGVKGGIPPFDDENTETTKKNIQEISNAQKSAITALHDMWGEYFLTEEQRLTIWYDKQRELFEGNQKLLNELEMVYQAKREDLKDKQLEDERTWLEQMAEQTKTFAEQTGDLITNVFDKVTAGIGNAVGQAIFESENLADALKNLLKGTAEMVVATLVGIGVRRLVLSMLNITTGIKEQISRMGQLTQQTYAAAFAATAAIPIVGPALAPAVAAASTAAMLAGSAGAKMAGMAIGGAAHGGLERVPREQTYLLERGERVIQPEQNRDLTAFLAKRQEGMNIENLNVTLEVLPHASNFEGLHQMTRRDWERLAEDCMIPAFRRLKFAGITA